MTSDREQIAAGTFYTAAEIAARPSLARPAPRRGSAVTELNRAITANAGAYQACDISRTEWVAANVVLKAEADRLGVAWPYPPASLRQDDRVMALADAIPLSSHFTNCPVRAGIGGVTCTCADEAFERAGCPATPTTTEPR
jgi:hypothetical protein